MLSGKSNDPTVIVLSARPADADGEPWPLGLVQAAHSTASARHAAERTVRCLGIVTPCLGIFPIMRQPLHVGQYRAGRWRRPGPGHFHCGKQINAALRQADRHIGCRPATV
jgi:hypothetical protein